MIVKGVSGNPDLFNCLLAYFWFFWFSLPLHVKMTPAQIDKVGHQHTQGASKSPNHKGPAQDPGPM